MRARLEEEDAREEAHLDDRVPPLGALDDLHAARERRLVHRAHAAGGGGAQSARSMRGGMR